MIKYKVLLSALQDLSPLRLTTTHSFLFSRIRGPFVILIKLMTLSQKIHMNPTFYISFTKLTEPFKSPQIIL